MTMSAITLMLFCVRVVDESQQLLPGAEPGGDAALLIELAEVVIIVGVVAHRRPDRLAALWTGGSHKAVKPVFGQRRESARGWCSTIGIPCYLHADNPSKRLAA